MCIMITSTFKHNIKTRCAGRLEIDGNVAGPRRCAVRRRENMVGVNLILAEFI